MVRIYDSGEFSMMFGQYEYPPIVRIHSFAWIMDFATFYSQITEQGFYLFLLLSNNLIFCSRGSAYSLWGVNSNFIRKTSLLIFCTKNFFTHVSKILIYFNTRSYRFTEVPAYSRIFHSHYCERSQQAECSNDFVPLTEPTFLPLAGHFGYSQLAWRDGRWVQDLGTYSSPHSWLAITSDSGFMRSSCRPQSELRDRLMGLPSPYGFAHCRSHCIMCAAQGIRAMRIWRHPRLPPGYPGQFSATNKTQNEGCACYPI